MKRRYTWNRITQCLLVLAGAFALKLHYSTASADQLRWILAPTAALVELVSGATFEFESHAGYISRERGLLIANSCAGVNFLIAAFLTLSMRKLLGDRSKEIAWGFIPTSALIAYLATLVANAARITIALLLRQSSVEIGWLNPDQLHRFEGVFIYFGFLLLLFALSEKMSAEKTSDSFRRSLYPLLVYYAIAIGVPLVTGAYRQGTEFWRHALFVLLIPFLLTISSLIFQISRVPTGGKLTMRTILSFMRQYFLPRKLSLRMRLIGPLCLLMAAAVIFASPGKARIAHTPLDQDDVPAVKGPPAHTVTGGCQ